MIINDCHFAGISALPTKADPPLIVDTISYSSSGSHESIQILQGQGYEVELKDAIYDGRLLCYYVPKLEEELLGLQYDGRGKKIDHRPNGSKDLADALAGAVYHCSLAQPPGTAEALMPRRGIVDTTEDI